MGLYLFNSNISAEVMNVRISVGQYGIGGKGSEGGLGGPGGDGVSVHTSVSCLDTCSTHT